MLTRRDMFRGIVFTTLDLALAPLARAAGRPTYIPQGPVRPFPTLNLTGSYRTIGYTMGKFLAPSIRTYLKRRGQWHVRLMKKLATPAGRTFSNELKRLTFKHFPHVAAEIEGMAEGSGLAFDALWAFIVQGEIGSFHESDLQCSTIHTQDRDEHLLIHNEDGHVANLDLMTIARVEPPSGVPFVAMIYPGITEGDGPAMNAHGIIQTTNYISTTSPEVGVPRFVISRAILEAKSLKEALQIATFSPQSHPGHRNLAGVHEDTYLSLESLPPATHDVVKPKGLYIHTNHLIHEKTKSYPFEDAAYINTSSHSRYDVLTALAAKLPDKPGPSDFLRILSSHEKAPYSPCRHRRGKIKGQTLGTALFDIRSGTFRLYRANPCTAVPARRFQDLPVR